MKSSRFFIAIPESIISITPTLFGIAISILDTPVSMVILELYSGMTKLILLAPLSIDNSSILNSDKLHSV